MRILLADPPAFTPQYDHELASALAHAGNEVELVTSRFRFLDVPEPDGYRRSQLFYPLSSRLFRRSRLRLPLKVVEHPIGLRGWRVARRTWRTFSGWRRRRSTSGSCASSPGGLHGARPAAATNGQARGPVAAADVAFRAHRRAQRARPRHPGGAGVGPTASV